MTGMTRGLLLGLSLALIAPAASAEFYKWTDANGVVHFTANLDEVPPSQRARAAGTAGGKGSFQRIESDGPGAAAAPAAPAPSSDPRSATPRPARAPGEASVERHGGRTEAQWGADARRYRDAITRLEEAAERCKNDTFRWSEGAGKRKWQEETAEAQACARVQNELTINRRSLESLEERAHRSGVPPGWIRD